MIEEKNIVERDLVRLYEIQDIINNLNNSTNSPINEINNNNQEQQTITSEKLISLEKELIIWKEKYGNLEKSKISQEQQLEKQCKENEQLMIRNKQLEKDKINSQDQLEKQAQGNDEIIILKEKYEQLEKNKINFDKLEKQFKENEEIRINLEQNYKQQFKENEELMIWRDKYDQLEKDKINCQEKLDKKSKKVIALKEKCKLLETDKKELVDKFSNINNEQKISPCNEACKQLEKDQIEIQKQLDKQINQIHQMIQTEQQPEDNEQQLTKKIKKKIEVRESQEDQEAQNYLELFSTVFQNDESVINYLPLNSSDPEELIKVVKDGVILCKLLNFVKSGTIDERAINKKYPLDEEQKMQNINLAISGAKSIGSMLGTLNAQEIHSGKQNAILNLIYQILKAGFLNTINTKECPKLLAMKLPNETNIDIAKLKPEELLRKWLGYVMSKSVRSKDKQILPNNFAKDLSDGECLLGVTEALLKSKWRDQSNEQVEKVSHALESLLKLFNKFCFQDAEELGIMNWTPPELIVAGNSKVNQILCAQLFHSYNGLNNITEEQIKEVAEEEQEDNDQTVSREERTFRMWVNSLSLPNAGYVSNLFDECTDGILLLKLIDSIKPGCVNWSRVEKNAQSHVIKQISNCNLAIETAKTELGLPLIGIGGKDIHDKNKKLVISLMHQLMLKDVTKTIGSLKEEKYAFYGFDQFFQHCQMGKQQSRKRILAYKKPQSYSIQQYQLSQDSNVKNSLFLLHLLHSINSKLIDWSMVYMNEAEDSLKQNAQYVISIARKLGASLFLVWEDIVELKQKMVMTLFAALKEYDHSFNL